MTRFSFSAELEAQSSSKHGSKSHQKEVEKLKKEKKTLQTQLEKLQRSTGARRQSR